MLQNLAFWKELGEVVKNFSTALGLILAGLWTYKAFIRQRLAFPRLDLTVTVQEASLARSVLVRAQVSLRNSGSVVATSGRGEIRLRQVLPPPLEIEEAVASGFDPVPAGCAQIEWPMLSGRKWEWEKGGFEIEPGESDTLCADFFVPPEVQVVELYFFLANARKKNQNIGWTLSHLHRISTQGDWNGREQKGYDVQGDTATRTEATAAKIAPSTTATEAVSATDPRQSEEKVARRLIPDSAERSTSLPIRWRT